MTLSAIIRNRRRTTWTLALVVTLGAGALLLHAFNPQPDPPKFFGLVGITASETIRLNVTNVGGTVGYPPPCRVQIGFVNADGAPIKMANASLADGHSASIALSFTEGSAAADALFARARVSVRPVISFSPPDPCFTAVSGEVIDLFGRTSLYLTPEVKMPAPSSALTN